MNVLGIQVEESKRSGTKKIHADSPTSTVNLRASLDADSLIMPYKSIELDLPDVNFHIEHVWNRDDSSLGVAEADSPVIKDPFSNISQSVVEWIQDAKVAVLHL